MLYTVELRFHKMEQEPSLLESVIVDIESDYYHNLLENIFKYFTETYVINFPLAHLFTITFEGITLYKNENSSPTLYIGTYQHHLDYITELSSDTNAFKVEQEIRRLVSIIGEERTKIFTDGVFDSIPNN